MPIVLHHRVGLSVIHERDNKDEKIKENRNNMTAIYCNNNNGVLTRNIFHIYSVEEERVLKVTTIHLVPDGSALRYIII